MPLHQLLIGSENAQAVAVSVFSAFLHRRKHEKNMEAQRGLGGTMVSVNAGG